MTHSVCIRRGDFQPISKSNSRTQSMKLSQNCATRAPAARGPTVQKIANAIENATFVYKPKMKPKLCGETGFFSFIGLRHEVGLGPSAFGPGCCSLASTVAHEAVHLVHGGESAAYGLEKKCFDCGN